VEGSGARAEVQPKLPRARDAIVVVPGLMGSELIDDKGRMLWGLRDPRWYVSAWTSGRSLDALRLSGHEREGSYGRVRPGRLLRSPAFAPFLAGFEPYTALLNSIRSVACHPSAIREFAYDWRLPVAFNGSRLAVAALDHLRRWRGSAAEVAARRADPDGDRPARLVMVAHSMGGLLLRQACLTEGFAAEVRATLTLGTPFFGAPKAVLMLASGRGYPLPRMRVRELAAALPGIYDILPSYRCVTEGIGARRLVASDITGVGGDGELAAASLAEQESVLSVRLPALTQVVGVHQPTVQALTLESGAAKGHLFTYESTMDGVQQTRLGGDGTVPLVSARVPYCSDVPLAQSHGALASHSDAIVIMENLLAGRRSGPWLGIGELGLDMPDIITAGQSWEVTITGAERPTDVTCSVVDVGTGLSLDRPAVGKGEEGLLVARAQPLPPGLFRVRIDGGGSFPVQQIVMSIGAAASGASQRTGRV
jgi:hypothetical protein